MLGVTLSTVAVFVCVMSLSPHKVSRHVKEKEMKSWLNCMALCTNCIACHVMFRDLQEFRFLLPCLPPLHWWLAKSLQSPNTSGGESIRGGKKGSSDVDAGGSCRGSECYGGRWVVVMLVVHVMGAMYLSTMHQAGTEQVFRSLSSLISEGDGVRSLLMKRTCLGLFSYCVHVANLIDDACGLTCCLCSFLSVLHYRQEKFPPHW